jgi:hypothetical protein
MPEYLNQIIKRKDRDERSLNRFKVWTGPKKKTGVNQDTVVRDVYDTYKDTPGLGGSIFTLGRRGVCMSYCAYYLVNRLADKGDFCLGFRIPTQNGRLSANILEGVMGFFRLIRCKIVYNKNCSISD